MNETLRKITVTGAEDLSYSQEYAEYIVENSAGDRLICNGDTLLEAQEDGYLWESFLDSMGLEE
jgi:hypothetical protein